jgi:membrane associated rhomboid family serine protease
MMPLGVAGRSKYRPYVTFSLIAINVVVLFIMVIVGTRGEAALLAFAQRYALDVCKIGVEPVTNSLAKAFSSMFIHGGWVHLIGNMFMLWIFAPRVEGYFGHKRFFIFYVLVGMGAFVGHLLLGGTVCNLAIGNTGFVVGASGAIAGVMGAFLFLYPAARVRTALVLFGFLPIKVFFINAWIYLGIWFLLDFVKGVGWMHSQGVAHWAHIGGFLFGFAVAFVATMYKPAPTVDAFAYLDD